MVRIDVRVRVMVRVSKLLGSDYIHGSKFTVTIMVRVRVGVVVRP